MLRSTALNREIGARKYALVILTMLWCACRASVMLVHPVYVPLEKTCPLPTSSNERLGATQGNKHLEQRSVDWGKVLWDAALHTMVPPMAFYSHGMVSGNEESSVLPTVTWSSAGPRLVPGRFPVGPRSVPGRLLVGHRSVTSGQTRSPSRAGLFTPGDWRSKSCNDQC